MGLAAVTAAQHLDAQVAGSGPALRQPRPLQVGVVELAHDLGAPVLVEQPELRREIHAAHGALLRRRSDGQADWRTESARPDYRSARPPVRPTARSCARTGSTPPPRGSAPSRR